MSRRFARQSKHDTKKQEINMETISDTETRELRASETV